MPRPPKTFTIPIFEDIRCLKNLVEEGKTWKEIQDYYGISEGSLMRYMKKLNK